MRRVYGTASEPLISEESRSVKINKDFSRLYIVCALFLAIAAGIFITHEWSAASAEIDASVQTMLAVSTSHPGLALGFPIANEPREKAPKQTVKGLYLTAYSANSPKKMEQIIDLIDQTELNAVVIDIKDYSGLVLYDSKIPLVNQLKLKDNRLTNLPEILKKLHEHKIYSIARQTVFQDPALAAKKTAWAIKSKNGGVWHDNKGLSWVDATKKEVWQYNIAIAQEATQLGFDEINFDYVRFPSDGNMSQVVYSVGNKKKYQIMYDFYSFLNEAMASEPVWTSFDMFGLVMETTSTNDMNIGQRLADAVDNVDYICPMMYPSHYPRGHLGLKNPADFPEKVFDNGMKKGLPSFKDKRAAVRPWIQAFNLGAVYDANKIRAQIDAVEKYTNTGWLMWNASNRYTNAGLKLE